MKKAPVIKVPKPKSMTANFKQSGRALFTQVTPPKAKTKLKSTRIYSKLQPANDPTNFGGGGFGNTGMSGEE